MEVENLRKKEIVEAALTAASTLIESGTADVLEEFASVKKVILYLETYAAELAKNVEDQLSSTPGEKDSKLGVEVQLTAPAQRLNYDEDGVYQRIKSTLKLREELLKQSTKAPFGVIVADENGEEVPRVTFKVSGGGVRVLIK